MGVAPEPTALQRLKGNPSKKKKNHEEPLPEIAKPTMPSHLSKEAKAEWRRVVDELVRTGILARVDRQVLANYCQAVGDWVDACKEWDRLVKEGKQYLHSNANGMRIHPIHNAKQQASAEILKYAQQLGLTPSARSKMRVDQQNKKKDSLKDFANKRSDN